MAKILIVDDEATFCKLAQSKLEASGYEVITANNGLEGLEKAENEHPDLILLDTLMPQMDGRAMLNEVRNREEIKDTLVIMCSSKIILKITENALKDAADAYLAKPFDPSVFLPKIKELLKKSPPVGE